MKTLSDFDIAVAPVIARIYNAREHFARALAPSATRAEISQRITSAQASLFHAHRDLQSLSEGIPPVHILAKPRAFLDETQPEGRR